MCTYYPSFLPRPKVETMFGKRDEILGHFREMARTHVGSKRFLWNTKLAVCRFDGSVWRMEDAAGNHVLTARFVLPCIFSISSKNPVYPTIAGRERFTGDAVHSSKLDKSLERFRGKKVVIIGCGASTLQIAPAVASVAESCTILRRTMPYVTQRQPVALPDSELGWAVWRWIFEARNDWITFFDSWVRLEVLLRVWFWMTNRIFLRPSEARPPFAQPVQCTRRCYDYCGFTERVRSGSISIVDVSSNRVDSYQERALVLADGTVVEADVVVYATGYDLAKGGADVRASHTRTHAHTHAHAHTHVSIGKTPPSRAHTRTRTHTQTHTSLAQNTTFTRTHAHTHAHAHTHTHVSSAKQRLLQLNATTPSANTTTAFPTVSSSRSSAPSPHASHALPTPHLSCPCILLSVF